MLRKERLIVGGAVLAALLLVIALLSVAGPAKAADKAGNAPALADLEERVAELEATVARKGNRKVSVTLSGTVHKGMLWHNMDGAPGEKRGAMYDPGHDPTRIRVDGNAKINKDWQAGFVVEIAYTSSTAQGVDTGKALLAIPGVPDGKSEMQFGDMGSYIRHSYLYLEGPAGRISLGQTSGASDGILEINLANTNVAVRPLSFSPIQFGGALSGQTIPFDGYRANVVKWDSPSMAGFVASASYSDNETWEAALKYAAEFSGFRVAAGISYRDASRTSASLLNVLNLLDLLTFDIASTHKAVAGSASIKHMGTGLFATAFASRVSYDFTGSFGILPPIFVISFPMGSDKVTGYGGQAGWEQNVTKLGNTTLFLEWQRHDSDNGVFVKTTTIGGGLVQSIDAAAMDLYVSVRKYDIATPSGFCVGMCEDATIVSTGARVRF